MYQYEYEKRPPSSSSCDSRATMTTDWSRSYPSVPGHARPHVPNACRPLPPRPSACTRMPEKTTVPLKVWIIASASCFAVCGALVLATVLITKWGSADTYTRELIETQAPIHTKAIESMDFDSSKEIELPILEKLSLFKNIVANREHKNLISKSQIHPLHEDIQHEQRNTKKKDKPLEEISLDENDNIDIMKSDINDLNESDDVQKNVLHVNELVVPQFKPILPNIQRSRDLDLSYGYDSKDDYFYNDENLYDDYMQSNTMTSYLIEKVQELHEWVSTDADLNGNHTTSNNDFSTLLKALNDSMVDGNITIVMSKLKDMYFGDNYTNANSSRKIIVTNSTDLLSFGILTLDVMLLHNIQLMAWENQESARIKMMKDPDVFAFNALFLDRAKLDLTQNDVHDGSLFLKRLNPRQDIVDDMDIGKNLLENILEVGMSTARAAIHLGRAYKNTKNLISQLQVKDAAGPSPLSRNIDANTLALNHLQTSFDSTNVANNKNDDENGNFYTELDCIWLLYCRNLVATTKLNAPYGAMARINGVALRMLTGELATNKALDTMLYEVVTGWTELKCNDMFPRCAKVNAASVVMDSLLGHRKSTSTNRGR